ncbi:hypothetical protein GH714_015798 [Hevea brasiliensis]|uniref:Uncharacterized protein n=1 Tax=Hevea brasiliensis TaxID=3981 RepID=A0A6A6LRV9_HEVBR|nr:hypothetical protein GH714_015798 [Hevea brasiliensis]
MGEKSQKLLSLAQQLRLYKPLYSLNDPTKEQQQQGVPEEGRNSVSQNLNSTTESAVINNRAAVLICIFEGNDSDALLNKPNGLCLTVGERGIAVVPVVGILFDKKAFVPSPNTNEVESIFDIPLEMFLKDENRRAEENNGWDTSIYSKQGAKSL